MINFSEDFFKEEKRLDFTVPESIKKCWGIQLMVLDEVLSIARRHNIQLWMEYGSLLGAVRHNGFIPWDDDLDMCIKREDYEKLLDILPKELPPEMGIQNYYMSDTYDEPKTFIRNRTHIDAGIDPKEAAITSKYFGCPYFGGIDLFPLDYIPSNKQLWNSIYEIYEIVYNFAVDYDSYLSSGEAEDIASQLEKILNTTIERGPGMRACVFKLMDSISKMTTKKEAGWLSWYPEYAMCGDRRKRSLAAYSDTLWVDFEMIKVPIPIGYDEVLRSEYGEDYMTPTKGTVAHEFPYFKIQEKIILFNNRLGQLGDIF